MSLNVILSQLYGQLCVKEALMDLGMMPRANTVPIWQRLAVS